MTPTSPTPATPTAPPKYTKKDFQSDQEIRWCPGCGDYAILAAVQQVLPTLGVNRENFVFISGIGCSSRFPYYMNTYGFHTIHGRAPAIATGVKLANPELEVWVATGDGDGLSIGGNHMIHALRRNVDLKILLFNNRIYGLTKGQYSPTTPLQQTNKSAPMGTVDQPINPISIALASEATFIARSVDIYPKHLMDILKRAHDHKGSAFIEIYQNCNVFNDKAFETVVSREVRDDQNVELLHGKPLMFGKNKDMGIRLNGLKPQVVRKNADGQWQIVVRDIKENKWVVPAEESAHMISDPGLLIYDEHDTSMAYLLSRIGYPDFPTPIGVYRAEKLPTLEGRVAEQIKQARAKGEGDLDKLLNQGDVWEVK